MDERSEEEAQGVRVAGVRVEWRRGRAAVASRAGGTEKNWLSFTHSAEKRQGGLSALGGWEQRKHR